MKRVRQIDTEEPKSESDDDREAPLLKNRRVARNLLDVTNEDQSSDEEEEDEDEEDEEELEEEDKSPYEEEVLVKDSSDAEEKPKEATETPREEKLSAKDISKEKARLKRQQQQEDTKNETVQKLLKKQTSVQVKKTNLTSSSRADETMSSIGKDYVARNDKGVAVVRHVDNATLGSFIIIPNDVTDVKSFLFN